MQILYRTAILQSFGALLGLLLGLSAAVSGFAQASLSPEQQQKVEAAIREVVQRTGVPSASVGIVQGGQIVYTKAFGEARLAPPEPAEASMAYPVGSISKQFTATAVLLLQQDGKLRLGDPVAKYFPQLTRAGEITIRNLLTHTSGYQDYAPQDYTIPRWRTPVDPLKVVEEFAGKPLDFEPGTQWQYSNTNFVLAALIVQKVSGMPFAEFLRTRVLEPARLEGVLNLNTEQAQVPVTGYMRNALAPLRPAAMEAPGWYFGDADLAMPVASLLRWDTTFVQQSLLTPESYREMETPFILKNGTDTHYGLGVFILPSEGQLEIEHSGEVGGFVAENIVLQTQGLAVAVLTNQEASGAAAEIARAILPLVRPQTVAKESGTEAAQAFTPRLGPIMTSLSRGTIDRGLLTTDTNDYFNEAALGDFQTSLAPFGAVKTVVLQRAALRGGMTFGSYRVEFTGGTAIRVTVYLEPDGKVEQLLVEGKE